MTVTEFDPEVERDLVIFRLTRETGVKNGTWELETRYEV